MEVLEQMRMLLREKAILFGQYEQETLRLDTDDLDAVDDIVDAVQARQALIDKINGLDRRIAAIGEASAYGARCFHIGKNQCDYAGLTEAEQAVFRVGQEVFAKNASKSPIGKWTPSHIRNTPMEMAIQTARTMSVSFHPVFSNTFSHSITNK